MKRAFFVTIVLVAAALGADASEQTGSATTPSKGAGDLLARLERTPCYGYCPSYSVEITRSGQVRYEGRDCVLTKGLAVDSSVPKS